MSAMLHRYPGDDPFRDRLQLARLETLTVSTAGGPGTRGELHGTTAPLNSPRPLGQGLLGDRECGIAGGMPA